MRSVLPIMSLVFVISSVSFHAQASDIIVKECSVSMKKLDSNDIVDMKMQIVSNNRGEVRSKITQSLNGQTNSYEDTAVISEANIRPDLLKIDFNDYDVIESLNDGERIIVHAYSLESEPEFKGEFKSGVDLSAVRSVKLFLIGKDGGMGTSTIVEAKDSTGKLLGSFLGGFLISPCK